MLARYDRAVQSDTTDGLAPMYEEIVDFVESCGLQGQVAPAP